MADHVKGTFDVFVSHSSRDKGWVRPFVGRLKAAGVKVWFDEDEVRWGEPILHAVERGLASSRHVIIVLSRSSVGGKDLDASPWVELELLITQHQDPSNRGRSLLPLKLDDCEIPLRLKALLYLDVSSADALEANMPRILKELGAPATTPTAAPPPSPDPGGPTLDLRALREELGQHLQQRSRLVMLCGDAGIPPHRVPALDTLELTLGQLLPELALPPAQDLKRLLRVVVDYYPQAQLRVTRASLRALGG